MIVNVDSDILAVASLKTDSIDMEIIERFEEKKRQREENVGKDLNKMRWFQVLRNGTGFWQGIRSLSLVGKTIVSSSVVYESYEIESHILTRGHQQQYCQEPEAETRLRWLWGRTGHLW